MSFGFVPQFKSLHTSVSDRIAKIFAIIVEKPGFRQLSAIKPNFNSIKTKNNPTNNI
jgi:hypothetical protein